MNSKAPANLITITNYPVRAGAVGEPGHGRQVWARLLQDLAGVAGGRGGGRLVRHGGEIPEQCRHGRRREEGIESGKGNFIVI